MGKLLTDALFETAGVLHWLGKYEEANALSLLSRLLRAHDITTLEGFEKMVVEQEARITSDL